MSVFFGISFIDPVWESIKSVIRSFWYGLWGVNPSDKAVAAIGISMIVVVLVILTAVHYHGWVHTFFTGLFVALDVVLSIHLLLYNTHWQANDEWLSMTICCSVPDMDDLSINVDGTLCPLWFSNFDWFVAILMVAVFIPFQFFMREQATALWCCCP